MAIMSESVTEDSGSSIDNQLLENVLTNNHSAVKTLLNDDESKSIDFSELFERNDEGKSVIELIICLGRVEILKELLRQNINVNTKTPSGYTLLHLAAGWNQLACLKCLVANEADIFLKTDQGESPKDIAERYGNQECVWFLSWAEVRNDFYTFLIQLKETVNDNDKVFGRLTKDDKNSTNSACADKIEWLNNVNEPTIEDIRAKRRELENYLEPVIHKLSEPPIEKQHRK